MATPARNWLDPIFFFEADFYFESRSRSTFSSLPLYARTPPVGRPPSAVGLLGIFLIICKYFISNIKLVQK
jgi:hypothetical protein